LPFQAGNSGAGGDGVQQALAAVPSRVVLIVDTLPLRAAAMQGLLRDWSATRRLTLAVLQPPAMPEAPDDVALVVLNLGGGSVAEAQAAGLLRQVMQAVATTPVAVISDREQPEEVVAALQAGARAFIPTSMAPEVALNALAFLLEGGSFFPPGALLEGRRSRTERWGGGPLPRNGTKLQRGVAEALGRTNSRQQQVRRPDVERRLAA
jgi:DNA-binding NarL/FixJ family response regulator